MPPLKLCDRPYYLHISFCNKETRDRRLCSMLDYYLEGVSVVILGLYGNNCSNLFIIAKLTPLVQNALIQRNDKVFCVEFVGIVLLLSGNS